MEDNMDQPRKGKRKADNSEAEEQKAKNKKNVLIDEAESKRVKKVPATEVQAAKDSSAKTIQSTSSKRLVEVVAGPRKSPPSRKGKKADKSISIQIGSKSSDNEDEQPENYSNTSTSKTVRNEERPQRFRQENVNKDPLYSESSSDDEKETPRFSKENTIKKFKDPIFIQNSSDSESSSDNEKQTQRFTRRSIKEKINKEFKDPILIQNTSDSETDSESESELMSENEREIIKDEQHEERVERLKGEFLETGKTENDSNIMPKEDQLILIKRIQEYIPNDDHRSYHYRLKQLEWHKVAFKDYTIDQCKQIWSQLFKKVRHYRLLEEITSDIQEIIKFNDLQAINTKRTKKAIKRHPAMPDRPMSAYFIYYTKNCDELSRKRSDLQGISFEKYISEKYQRLSLKNKQKYDLMAVEMRKDYKVKLAKFYEDHPHIKKEKQIYKKHLKVQTEDPPKEPQKPFGLFLASESINQNREDKTEFRKECRKKWKKLPESVKLLWINQADEESIEYRKKLSEYMARHPKFVPNRSKSRLTREENLLKAKLSGKPKKPPITAFNLFISTILSSEETKNLAPQEGMKYCSIKWKTLPQEEKDRYKELLKKKQHRYDIDFKKYLETLPEDKRQEEIAEATKNPLRRI